MKQGLVRLLYNLGKVHGVDITHDNVCSSMLSCFYSHLLSTGRPISSIDSFHYLIVSPARSGDTMDSSSSSSAEISC